MRSLNNSLNLVIRCPWLTLPERCHWRIVVEVPQHTEKWLWAGKRGCSQKCRLLYSHNCGLFFSGALLWTEERITEWRSLGAVHQEERWASSKGQKVANTGKELFSHETVQGQIMNSGGGMSLPRGGDTFENGKNKGE